MLKDRATKKAVDERTIEAFIDKGGSAAVEEPKDEETPQNVQLRLLPSLMVRIDAVRKRKPKEIRQSRHSWMIEAILEKLQREE
jgi:hypothetical protein